MGTDIHGVFQKKTESGWEDVESEYGEERHYALFAWIGNVRNGFGFAEIPTHDRIDPLSDNRGLPCDFNVINDEYRPIKSNAIRGRRSDWYKEEDSNPESEDHLRLWMGDHSHSWLNAEEIIASTPPKILRTGYIPIAEFQKWDGESSPERWSGGIDGASIIKAENPSEVTEKTTHVRIEWFEDTKETFAYFIDEVKRLKELHGEVRFVFGFDS